MDIAGEEKNNKKIKNRHKKNYKQKYEKKMQEGKQAIRRWWRWRWRRRRRRRRRINAGKKGQNIAEKSKAVETFP
jgi:hypothetical protein